MGHDGVNEYLNGLGCTLGMVNDGDVGKKCGRKEEEEEKKERKRREVDEEGGERGEQTEDGRNQSEDIQTFVAICL